MIRISQFLRNSQLSFRISPPLARNSRHPNVRYVKFQRPWIRKLFTAFLLYGTAFHLWSSFVLLQFDAAPEDDDSSRRPSMSEKYARANRNESDIDTTGEMEDFDEDPIHIPLSWPRRHEGKFYAASDPEWQEFVKFARDHKKIRSLKDELATIVLNNASRSSLLSHVLGQPLNITGFWLLHHFPSRAPPEYDRLCLEINDTGVYLVTKRMSSEDGDKLQRFMRPVSVALAIKDAYMVFFRRQLLRLQDRSSDREHTASTSDLSSSKHAFSRDTGDLDGLNHIAQSESQLPLPDSHQEKLPRDNEYGNLHPSSIISSVQRLPLPKFGPGSDFYLALLAFKWRLTESWARASHTPRRGTFYITGPVGLKGPRGFCRVEVRGEYDPAASSWTAVKIQLKDLNVFKQKPLGGP
ncbi:uncharacterized protein ACHE_60730A [Aspergillus chevalieri]|uniref:Uncharacterized protein n=1 Tax=Aspergillus chevalieri TaxID=182096 RepID=A0A7R7ZRM5_ASPCH|nr:uncharacterized protein ACHE_60730A [Aspergillus chevalieri]BCR90844.1 hypothetical protein ACHE_60730A [Aspergillus chevalieri]